MRFLEIGEREGMRVEFEPLEHGWMEFRCDDFEQVFSTVGYDSLRQLVDALVNLLLCGDGRALFWAEPEEFDFVFQEDEFRIVRFPDRQREKAGRGRISSAATTTEDCPDVSAWPLDFAGEAGPRTTAGSARQSYASNGPTGQSRRLNQVPQLAVAVRRFPSAGAWNSSRSGAETRVTHFPSAGAGNSGHPGAESRVCRLLTELQRCSII
jgi:hypothetical protein